MTDEKVWKEFAKSFEFVGECLRDSMRKFSKERGILSPEE